MHTLATEGERPFGCLAIPLVELIANGLLAEHVDPATREPWGNFVQTYSMVGMISAAKRLSMPWDEAF